jgi:hypothetical protein
VLVTPRFVAVDSDDTSKTVTAAIKEDVTYLRIIIPLLLRLLGKNQKLCSTSCEQEAVNRIVVINLFS